LNYRKLLFSIIENWPVKVLSIALALVLFVFNRLNTMATRPLSVPLSIETNSLLIPASSYPQNIRVTLRGEDDGLKSIVDSDIEAFVDFTRYELVGLYSAPVQIRKKGSAMGVEPLEISVNPLEISVHLDRRIIKVVPLTAAIQGRVAEGFDMVSYSMNPLELVVTGPMGALESISEIQTEPIDIDGRNGDFSVVTGIVNLNPFFVIRGSGTVEFSGIVRPSVSVRSIEGLPIAIIGLSPGFEADIGGKTGNVRIEGSQSLLDQFQPHSRFLTVNCSGLSQPGNYTLPVVVDLPRGLTLIRQEPDTLSLTIMSIEGSL